MPLRFHALHCGIVFYTLQELVLRIVLEKPDLKVLDVRTQVFVENLLDRSVRLDILATDSTGAKLNVEV